MIIILFIHILNFSIGASDEENTTNILINIGLNSKEKKILLTIYFEVQQNVNTLEIEIQSIYERYFDNPFSFNVSFI